MNETNNDITTVMTASYGGAEYEFVIGKNKKPGVYRIIFGYDSVKVIMMPGQ